MIGYLAGTIIHIGQQTTTLQVGGVGYEVFISPLWLAELQIGTEEKMWVHHVVREDVSDLYGVRTPEELIMFKALDSVSGVGPKSVIAILSFNSPDDVRRAIVQGETGVFTRVSGIGKKTAERIVLELRSKFGDDGTSMLAPRGDADVVSALIALGYPRKDAEIAAGKVKGDGNMSALVKEALKYLM
ncbi:MAG: Holliday junction branch migration protein RuvA [Candidatus Yanofskybacteria bacterium]|nr:Holliday junction branch migration protein RuvA [Candidatus Yanofskybacteria bacterium]